MEKRENGKWKWKREKGRTGRSQGSETRWLTESAEFHQLRVIDEILRRTLGSSHGVQFMNPYRVTQMHIYSVYVLTTRQRTPVSTYISAAQDPFFCGAPTNGKDQLPLLRNRLEGFWIRSAVR